MSDSFERIWNERMFVYDPNQALDRQLPCTFAVAFQAWLDVLFEKHLEDADSLRLNQLKLQVHDRFFEFHRQLPSSHRHEDGRDPTHPCVFRVFERAMNVLTERALELDPPPLLPPAPPPEPPRPPRKPKRTRLDILLLGDEDPEFDG